MLFLTTLKNKQKKKKREKCELLRMLNTKGQRENFTELFIISKKARTVKSSCFYKQKDKRKQKYINRNDLIQNVL